MTGRAADTTIVERCPARAALAGNPSDGYGGAVLAVPVAGVAATCAVTPADRFELHADGVAPVVVDRWETLTRLVDTVSVDDAHALVLAAMGTASEFCGDLPPISIEVRTTIPRSVGLAGSSAIVIATLRAVLGAAGHEPPHPDLMAVAAFRTEADRLGIAAGLQDRVVQAHARPMMMRFGPAHRRVVGGTPCGTYEPVDVPDDLRIVVALRRDTADPSPAVHAALRRRVEGGDVAVGRVMAELAVQAEHAAAALARADLTALGGAIDATFELRRSAMPLDPRHVEMVEIARRAGGHANYTGSGGAVAVLCADAGTEERVVAALASIGCEFVPRHAGG